MALKFNITYEKTMNDVKKSTCLQYYCANFYPKCQDIFEQFECSYGVSQQRHVHFG